MPDILQEILAFLVGPRDIATCLHVCRAWYPVARHRLYRDVRLDGFERCSMLLTDEAERSRLGRLVRGLTVTRRVTAMVCPMLSLTSRRASAVLFADISSLAPGLRTLTLSSTATIASSTFTAVLPLLTSLAALSLVNQDFRAVANPFSSLTGTDAALAALASAREAARAPGLTSLSIIGSPDLTSEGLARYLETAACGAALLVLELASCGGIGEQTLDDVAACCPDLRELTVRGQVLSVEGCAAEERSRASLAAVATSCTMLNSLCLNKFPLAATATGDTDLLKPFTQLEHLARVELASISWFTSADLAHFVHVTTLRCGHLANLRSLPTLPELRSFTWTGSAVGAFSLGGLYDFCDHSPHLRRLILDWTDHWERFSPGTPSRSSPSPPSGQQEHRPACFADYADRPVFEWRVPSQLVARALSQATSLESVAIFGFVGRRLGWQDVRMMERVCPHLLRVD
jgi:hypothetical protein